MATSLTFKATLLGAILIAICGCGVPDRDAVHLAEVWDSALNKLDSHDIVRIRVHALDGAGHELKFVTVDRKTIATCVNATHHVEPAPNRAFNQPDGIQFEDGHGRTTRMHINFINGRHDLGPQMTACFENLEKFPVR